MFLERVTPLAELSKTWTVRPFGHLGFCFGGNAEARNSGRPERPFDHPEDRDVRSTEVGDRIVFMPKGRRFDIWNKHPLVSRLEDYAAGSVNWMADADDGLLGPGKKAEGPFQVRPEDRGRILPPAPRR